MLIYLLMDHFLLLLLPFFGAFPSTEPHLGQCMLRLIPVCLSATVLQLCWHIHITLHISQEAYGKQYYYFSLLLITIILNTFEIMMNY